MASEHPDWQAVAKQLANLAVRFELEAAHHAELIVEGRPASAEVRYALDAAVCEGIAHGLRVAAVLIAGERAG